MKRAAAMLLLAAACAPSEPARELPPDIVVLLADDLGWGDVGWHASEVETPNLDRLAREGLVLERYYTAPLCSPARAGLLTGRSPVRMGVLGNFEARDAGGLAADEELLPAALQRAGYATHLIGKWHLGDDAAEQHPTARGFDHVYGLLGGWVDYRTHERNGTLDWQRDGVAVREEGWTTDLLAREAVRVLAEHSASQPLFLYVAFNAPHPPLKPSPRARVSRRNSQRLTLELVVSDLDRAIGEIVAAIESSPRARDTLVFFASDNGADLRFGGSNAPLREGKATVQEGGIRVPALLWGRERVAPGKSERVMTHLDVLPTLAGAAGIALEPARQLDGRDLWPSLATALADDRAQHAFGCQRDGELRLALIQGAFKLIEIREASGAVHRSLYDVAHDASEAHDLAGEQPAIVSELSTALAQSLR